MATVSSEDSGEVAQFPRLVEDFAVTRNIHVCDKYRNWRVFPDHILHDASCITSLVNALTVLMTLWLIYNRLPGALGHR